MGGIRNHEGYMDLTAYYAIKNSAKEKRKMTALEIKRGDIFEIDRPNGESQPAVVVSNNVINDNTDCCIVIYLTDRCAAISETDVSIRARTMRVAQANRVYTIHRSKFGEYIRTCDDDELAALDNALGIAFGLEPELIDPEESSMNTKPAATSVVEPDPETDALKAQYEEAREHAELMEKRAAEAERQAEELEKKLCMAEAIQETYKELYEDTLDKLLGAMA